MGEKGGSEGMGQLKRGGIDRRRFTQRFENKLAKPTTVYNTGQNWWLKDFELSQQNSYCICRRY
jgi:hypothetical protein